MQVSKYDNYQSYHQHIHDTVAGHVHVYAYCGNILNIVANILSYSKCYLGNKCTKYTHTFAWIITRDSNTYIWPINISYNVNLMFIIIDTE